MNKTCVFLTTDNLEEFFIYDDLVKPYLQNLGWKVSDVSWRDTSVDYNTFDVVIVRSPWDYQNDPEDFLSCLGRIDDASCQLENPLALMNWNLAKTYLKDLAKLGVPVLPTLWHETFDSNAILDAFDILGCKEIVIKPVVSANADDTFRLTAAKVKQNSQTLHTLFQHRPFMVQAFEESIVKEGEVSLFYFDSTYSHAILKTPAKDDFRVQEEHGGQLRALNPTAEVIALGDKTMAALPLPSLYARIDIVNTLRGPELIEVELIEPSLYFNMDAQSPKRFADAIHRRFG